MAPRALRARLRTARLCVLFFALGGQVLIAEAESKTLSRKPGEGVVTFVSGRRAYLNLGKRDGLSVGDSIELTRGGSQQSRCQLESVADHFASCSAEGLRKGDAFHVAAPAELATASGSTRPGQILPDVGALARMRSALSDTTFERIEFRRQEVAVPGGHQMDFVVSHATWAIDGLTPFNRERIGMTIRGIEIAGGVRANVAATAQAWPTRPSDMPFSPGTPMQLYVRELSLSARDPGRPYAGAVGRVWPWHLPGIVALDGAQAAWRGRDGLEIGAYGGALPDPMTLGVGFSRWVSGAYWAVDSGDTAGPVRFLRHEGRAGVVMTPEAGLRVEADAVLLAAFGHAVDLNVDARGSSNLRSASLDAAHLSLVVRPGSGWRVWGEFSSLGAVAAKEPMLPFAATASHRGDLGASWSPSSGLGLAASAGYVSEYSTGILRFFAGPQLDLPRLFGESGGLSVGYDEELGNLPGRMVWVQPLWSPHRMVRVLGRLSYMEERPESGFIAQDLGAMVSLDVNLWRFLFARVSVFARTNIATEIPDRSVLGTVTVEARL